MVALLESRAGEIRAGMQQWFQTNARDLPWRRTRDPYRIWVSEVMLQQTRVNAVLDHYARFVERFPTVRALADTSEAEVLTAWSGLGYYRRARMMHRAAQAIAREHGERLPRTAEALRTLPGIGDYTAAAVASIAFSEPVAVIDGNVERVLLRLPGLGADRAAAATVRRSADLLLDVNRPGEWNQAMMELGATVCLPKAPLCLQCPVQRFCATRGEHAAGVRKPLMKRQIAYALARRGQRDGQVLLVQRAGSASLMAGMWELPQVALELIAADRLVLRTKHAITVTNYNVSILSITEHEAGAIITDQTARWVSEADLVLLPLTGLARKVFRRLHMFSGQPDSALTGTKPEQLHTAQPQPG